MTKAVNYTVYSKDSDFLDRVFAEYDFLGRNVRRFADKVVVYAYPKRKPVKPKREDTRKRETDEEKTKRTNEQRSKRERWYE